MNPVIKEQFDRAAVLKALPPSHSPRAVEAMILELQQTTDQATLTAGDRADLDRLRAELQDWLEQHRTSSAPTTFPGGSTNDGASPIR